MDAAGVPDLVVEPSALYPPWSGAGYYTRELLKAYAALPGHLPVRFLVYRFFLKPGRKPTDRESALLAGIPGAELEFRLRLLPGAVHTLLRKLCLRPPFPLDAFGSGKKRLYFFPDYVGQPVARSPYIPVVFDFGFLKHPETLEGRDHLFLKRYVPGTLKGAARVVVISEYVKNELEQAFGVPKEKIAVIRPAVDHGIFKPDVPFEARKAVRARYRLEGGYVFSLSTLEPRKNFRRLIEAYALLPESLRLDHPLVIAGGKGWKNRDVFDVVTRRGLEKQVRFLGYVPEEDRAPLLREATVFTLPSLYEGFGMPVLEAMACGTPVVTSSGGALPEVGGEAVLYVDPLDPESIAKGIVAALTRPDLREQLSAAGLKRAAEFRWEDGAGALDEIFRLAVVDR
ncbi:MAG: glycosyltransferase family 4 protein [Candidatus Aminicenantes bacterium]|nr:glycosyltransferase family 4 protein [Candidatus Aminicenantes bacterium]